MLNLYFTGQSSPTEYIFHQAVSSGDDKSPAREAPGKNPLTNLTENGIYISEEKS